MPGFEPGTSPTRTARATRLRYTPNGNRVSEPMRVLCLGLDGADYDLVRKLLAQGRLPTLARLSRAGNVRAAQVDDSGLHADRMVVVPHRAQPGRATASSPSPRIPTEEAAGLENAASRAGAPLWRYLGAAGIRSAFVTVPFTHPPEPLSGMIVTGFGGPRARRSSPLGARNAILAAHPDLRVSRHPADLRTSRPRPPRSWGTSTRSRTSASSPSSSSPTSVSSASTS